MSHGLSRFNIGEAVLSNGPVICPFDGCCGNHFLSEIILDAKAEESSLIQSCLNHRPFAWQKFVDRFLAVVLKTVHEIDAQSNRGWSEEDHHQMALNVFRCLKDDDHRLLREWDSSSDFETWLIIAARRITLAVPEDTGSGDETGSDEAS